MKHLVTLVGLFAFLMVVLPGPLYKFNIVELGTAFAGFRLGVYVGGAALALLLVQVLFMRKTVSLASAVITAIFAAVAIAMHALSKTDKNSVDLKVQGGSLNVAFNTNNGTYTNVWLTGPAEQVFKGEVSW